MTLEQIMNDSNFSDLFDTPNSEVYKGWLIYEQDGNTIASITEGAGILALHVKGTTNAHRTAMKMEIDNRE